MPKRGVICILGITHMPMLPRDANNYKIQWLDMQHLIIGG